MISASSIKLWRECERKWFYRYVRHLRPPAHPSAAFGSEVHGHLARWLALGESPPETLSGVRAHSALPYLPAPGTAISVEGHRLPVTALPSDSRPFVLGCLTGVKDLEYRNSNGSYVVHDHKTCGDFRYALNSDSLRTDEQGVIYAAETFATSAEPVVILEWLYLPRSGRPRPVIAIVSRAEIDDGLGALESVVRLLLAPPAEEKDALQNTASCNKYGGCPHREICKPDLSKQIGALL